MMGEEDEIITLDLEPIALLYHTSSSNSINGHRKLLAEEGNEDKKNHHPPSIPIHPFSNAVYSSVVELDERSDVDIERVQAHNKIVQEMNSLRHLSRFEQFHMSKNDGKNSEEVSELRSSDETAVKGTLHDDRRRLQQNINLRGGLPPLMITDNGENQNSLYNDFQSTPLSQGYGTHYATVW